MIGRGAQPTDPLFELIDDPICVTDFENGAFVRVNPAWTEAFGWSVKTLGKQLFAGLVHPDDQPAFATAVRRAGAGDREQRKIENRFRDAQGEYRRCAWTLLSSGGLLYAVARERSTKPAGHDELIAAFDAVGDGLCWMSVDGLIVDLNERYADLVGAPRAKLIGSFPPHAEGDPAERAQLLEVAASTLNGVDRRIEIDITRADGRRVRVAVAGCPVPESATPDGHVLVAVRDLSRERSAELSAEQGRRWMQFVGTASRSEIWIGDAAGEAEWVDPRLAKRIGETPEAMVGKPFDAFASIALRGPARAAVDGARRTLEPRDLQTRLRGPGRTEQPADVHLHPIEGDDGRCAAIVATVTDHQEGAPPQRSGRPSGDMLDMLGAAVVSLDGNGRICNWNEGARRILGFTAAEAVGQRITNLMPEPEQGEMVRRARALAKTGKWQGQLSTQRKDGTPVSMYAHAVRLASPHGSVVSVVVAMDMSEREEAETQLDDARGYLNAVASSMAEGLFAIAPDGRLAYMNPQAEKLLGWRMAELKGRHLHAAIHYQRADGSPFPAHECPMVQTPMRGSTLSVEDDVLTRKDGTLLPIEYTTAPIRTARGSRGTVVVFRDVARRKAERERLEHEIEGLTWVGRVRDALDQDRLVLYAQPILDVATGDVVQHELLLRMLLDGEVIPPGDFLPHAEEHGLIVDVDRWVIRQAAKLAAEGSPVELNLSAKSLSDPLLLSEVDRVLRDTGADPSKLIFEITETALVEDEAAARAFAEEMHRLGCGLALDDFGSGYSGFTYLKQLPLQYLKIDTEFVRDLLEEESSVHVVTAVVNLARSFGLKSVAEGVESLETMERLRSLGVDLAQGYALGMPGPVRDVLGRRAPRAGGPTLAGSTANSAT